MVEFIILTEVDLREGRLTLIVLPRDGVVSWLLSDVMAVAGGHAHDDILDHPLRRLLADGLRGRTGQVTFEAHRELAIALAQLMRTGISAGLGGFTGN